MVSPWEQLEVSPHWSLEQQRRTAKSTPEQRFEGGPRDVRARKLTKQVGAPRTSTRGHHRGVRREGTQSGSYCDSSTTSPKRTRTSSSGKSFRPLCRQSTKAERFVWMAERYANFEVDGVVRVSDASRGRPPLARGLVPRIPRRQTGPPRHWRKCPEVR